METLGERIRSRREELGLSQSELARRSSLNQPTLQRIESGASADPSFSLVVAIARALGAPVEALAGDAEAAATPPAPPADRLATLEAEVAALQDQMVTALKTAGDALSLARQLQQTAAPARTRRGAS